MNLPLTVTGKITATSLALTDGGITATNDILINNVRVATITDVNDLATAVQKNSVWSFNKRTGVVVLELNDVLKAGGAPIVSPHFGGNCTAPTVWDPRAQDDTIATTAWVQNALCWWYDNAAAIGALVTSFNGRGGAVVLNSDDITLACTATGAWPQTNTPVSGDTSKKIANTAFVDDAVYNLQQWTIQTFETSAQINALNYAPINSPAFTGTPTAPTPAHGDSTGNLATTAFVQAAIVSSTTGVASFNTRTGAVVLTATDVSNAGGALLAGPIFTGVPQAPTPTVGDSSQKIATTAFVANAVAGVAAGVTSFNARTGAVVLTTADVTAVGAALLASPAFTGTPKAPTPLPADNSTNLATTAYVTAAVAALPAPVTSVNGRVGAVTLISNDISAAGGALLASPAFTGTPTAPTQTPGTSNTDIATTAFVQAAVASVVTGVSSFNTRTGTVTLTSGDVTGVGGALLAGPTFTGTPSAPTAAPGTNSGQLATTAFVQAALSAAPGGVSSFNTRTGAITLVAGDVSAAGGALISSPHFTGVPQAPTPSPGDNSVNIATTAFVTTALAAAGGVNSFNGRAGAVSLLATDVYNAEGAIYTQQDTAPTTGPQTFWFDSIHGQLFVQYIDPSTSAKSWVQANSMQPATPPGSRVLLSKQVVTSPVASVNFVSIDWTSYDIYEIEIYGVNLNVGAAIAVRTSTNAGSTWDAGVNYAYAGFYTGFSISTVNTANANSTSYIAMTNGIDTAAGRFINVSAKFYQYKIPTFFFESCAANATNGLMRMSGVGYNIVNQNPINGMSFITTLAGNFTAGTFIVYGVAK
jgi:hypothetical protein